MMLFKGYKIRSYEIGLFFRDDEFVGLLGEGRHWLFDPLGKVRIEIVSYPHGIVGDPVTWEPASFSLNQD